MKPTTLTPEFIQQIFAEDIGDGDLSAQLIPDTREALAEIRLQEDAIIYGEQEAMIMTQQFDPGLNLSWLTPCCEWLHAGSVLATLQGSARSILTLERSLLNMLQTLSGTATATRRIVERLGDSKTQLLDTRKTLPGLRLAQKAAVVCGGGKNHRLGLYDQFLIKENHIAAAGGIAQAVAQARALKPNTLVEVEVENLLQLSQALAAKADIVMLDNFSPDSIVQAVRMNQGRVKLEVSGNLEGEKLNQYANLGVDYLSSGALTKHVQAVDLSLRLVKTWDGV